MEKEFPCPYCGHPNSAPVDEVDGRQEWTVDCENCCRPISLKGRVRRGRLEGFDSERELD